MTEVGKPMVGKEAIEELDDKLEVNGVARGLGDEPIVEEDEWDESMDPEEAATRAAAAAGSTAGLGGPALQHGQFVHPNRKNHRSGSMGSNKSGGAAGDAGSNGRHLVRKAKRSPRDRAYSTSEDGRFGGVPNSVPMVYASAAANSAGPFAPATSSKNSRRSRNALGRGLPKKGGAGGKGTWGKLGCELELPWVDPNDPNYESEEDQDEMMPTLSGGSFSGVHPSTTLKPMVPEMSEEDVAKTVEPLILEYFENNDALEVLYTLQEMLMNLGSHRWMIVSILVELAMDHKPSHREMASVLISELYLKVISQRDIGKAFDHLLLLLPDSILDTPDAPEILGNFMARCIADDCIPPKFLYSYKGKAETKEARAALLKADTLLSMKHGMVRLDNVWGVGGGIRPVKYLVKKIVLLLKEYLSSGDIAEATRCLKELEVPHFHHELVYEAVLIVIEAINEKTETAMCKLLQSLFRSFVITIDQVKNGFFRVYDVMPEFAIDVPAAYSILERFTQRCKDAGIVTDEIVRHMPTRGRKRFVSEGDEVWARKGGN